MPVSGRFLKTVDYAALDSELGIQFNTCLCSNFIRSLKADTVHFSRKFIWVIKYYTLYLTSIFIVQLYSHAVGYSILLKEHNHIPEFMTLRHLCRYAYGLSLCYSLDFRESLRFLFYNPEGVLSEMLDYLLGRTGTYALDRTRSKISLHIQNIGWLNYFVV